MQDGPPDPRSAYAPFDPEDIIRLSRYVTRVDKLVATEFMQTDTIGLKLSGEVGKAATATVSGVTDEALERALFILRPLWLSEEAAGFSRVQALVKRHAHLKGTAEGKVAIEHMKTHTRALDSALKNPDLLSLREQRVDQTGAIVSTEDVAPRRIFEDFLHGHYFHEDQERIDRIGNWLPSELQRFIFIGTVHTLARIYLSFGVIVRGILGEPSLRA